MKVSFTVPGEYHPKAKAYIRLIVRQLNESNSLEEGDKAALLLLADTFNTYTIAREILLTNGITINDPGSNGILPGMELSDIQKLNQLKINPALKIASDCHNQITRLLIEFNLTPRSRKKPDFVEPPETEISSPIDRFISKNVELRKSGNG